MNGRLIVALVVTLAIIFLVGYIAYLRVAYDVPIEVTLGVLATCMGYMLRYITEPTVEEEEPK